MSSRAEANPDSVKKFAKPNFADCEVLESQLSVNVRTINNDVDVAVLF